MRHNFLSLVALALITVNLASIIFGIEDWPLTPAPMFAKYIDSDSKRYRFAFVAHLNSGATKELGYYSVNAHWSLMRFFFRYVYGSVNPDTLSYRFPNDNPQLFRQRLGRFFLVYLQELKKHNPSLAQTVTSINLDLVELNWKENAEISRQHLGTFSATELLFKSKHVD